MVLVGSAARGKRTWRSDTDILIIQETSSPRRAGFDDIQLLYQDRDAFERRLETGDEFAEWALRFGEFLSGDSAWWKGLKDRISSYPWPDWQSKLVHLNKRLSVARKALSDADAVAAEEELLMAASHLARGILLKAGVFPLSRPELAHQLDEIQEREVAGLLSELSRGSVSLARLASIHIKLAAKSALLGETAKVS